MPVMFCMVQDINDILGKYSSDNQVWIISGGKFDPSMVERLIARKSKRINEEHGMNFNPTTVTDEYHDIVGNPRMPLDKYPVISVTELSVYDGTEYTLATQGRDRNNDDYWLEKPNSGMVRFWDTPDVGTERVKTTYIYGHSEIPSYVEECCILMTAVDLATSREFQEECKEQINKWEKVIGGWMSRVEELLNTKIRHKNLAVHTIGKWRDESVVSELEDMTDE
ncbi:hypothetical protein [Sulfuricurvum sp.]|uniref:hypothetical protein n=1 Tax=Sulfuricurvum sp. TaxID=2025608 RepID=UPI00356A306D